MNIDRNTFIETFASQTPAINLVVLNHMGPPSKLLADTSSIDLLADKKSKAAFINYCKTHPLVRQLTIAPKYRKTEVLLEFQDGSEINFRLISNIVQKTLLCLDVADIRKSSHVNEFGMLVPSQEHHFEYMMLKTQFNKDPLSERFKNYFSQLTPAARSVIFKYVQTRFNLVFNTLEDLYVPKPNMLLAIIIGLRSENSNTLFLMFLRSIELGLFNLFGWFTKKEKHIPSSPLHAPVVPSQKKRTAGQAVW